MRLPEKTRRTLERIVNRMRSAENVYGIGLFGSWSRGDAVSSSDIDLLVLDAEGFSGEYVERIEAAGLLIDLDHVPKQWLLGPIPPELDQKLYELQILYDRDWQLTNTKLLMSKSFASPERIEIRTEAQVVQSDIYLSRASSAFSREDFRSAHLFGNMALENILQVLVEIALQPISNSHFIENLECSAEKLGVQDLCRQYLKNEESGTPDASVVKDKLGLFAMIWNDVRAATLENVKEFESSHFRVKSRLKYYLTPVFLQGAVGRTSSLIEDERFTEAFGYLRRVLVDLIENYVGFKASRNKVRIDYTTLMRSLESLEEKNRRNYECVARFLNLEQVDKAIVVQRIEEAHETVRRIRMERKALIRNCLTKA